MKKMKTNRRDDVIYSNEEKAKLAKIMALFAGNGDNKELRAKA